MSNNLITHLAKLTRDSIPPIHKGGLPIIGITALAGLGTKIFTKRFGMASTLLTGAVALFFREPKRVAPSDNNVIVGSADGEVALIEEALPPAELGVASKPLTRISIFLTVLDVHVQRAPIAGKVKQVTYHPGKFLSADLDKASEVNERNTVIFADYKGNEVIVTQIAGLIARRIVCDIQEGQELSVGDTYGLIRFGSRVDIYLPKGAKPSVGIGQRVIGGETVVARFEEKQ
ncbi:MAG: phosphatidylserine decarboxylase [Micrococcaceae bacterium]